MAVPVRTPRGSVILPLPWSLLPPLAPTLELPEGRFSRKAELHLTVLSSGEAHAVLGVITSAALLAQLAEHDWSVRASGRMFLLRGREDGRPVHSVIVEVACPALNACRRVFARASGRRLAETFPHVTTHLAGTTKGIGLASRADFEAKRLRELDGDERARLYA